MSQLPVRGSVLRFTGFELDQQRGELRGPAGEAIRLRPKAFDMLRLFATQPGRILSKQILMTTVWPNIHVGEDSLFQCVREVRAALGDDERQIIKAVSGRGYMFDAEVTDIDLEATRDAPALSGKVADVEQSAGRASEDKSAHAESRRFGFDLRIGIALAVAVVAITGLVVAVTILRPRFIFAPARSTIAIMPITVVDSEAPATQMAANVTSRLTDGLAKIDNLRVVMPSKDATQANYVINGELQQSEQSWTVWARLSETTTGEVKWSTSVSVDLAGTDIQLQQSRLAAGLGHDLALRINELMSLKTRASAASNTKVVVEQATAQINQTSPERFRVAQAMLEKALTENPGDVDLEVALAGLMLRGVQMVWYSPADSKAAEHRAQSMLEHALHVGPNSVPVHEAYCRLLATTNQFSASLVACARVLTLDPWNGMALYLIGLSQLKLGRFEDALATFKQADQFDTPRVSRWTWALGAGWTYMMMGKPEDALPWIQKSIAITPASGRSYFLLAAIYQQLGRTDEARAATAKGMEIRPSSNAKNVRVPEENASPIYIAAADRLVSLAVAAGLPER